MTILQKVSLEDIKVTQGSIETASGLPNAAYNDPELFDFERDNIIGKTWAGLDFVSELPQKGYAKPIDFMGLPLLLVRDRKDQIKVFHNVCSHRGMILVAEAGPVRNLIRCRYHSWSYNLEGELKSTPHIGGVGHNNADGFSCEGNGLKEVSSAQWMGVIFVNLSGDAMPFAEFIAPLQDRWETFTGKGKFQKLHVADDYSHTQLTVKSNWKLAIENYCEAYHLPWVHPDLNSYSPLEEHVNLQVNDYMSGQGTMNYTLSEVAGYTLPKFQQWPEDKMTHGEYISLYPNVMLGVQVDHAFALIVEPKSCNQSVERLQICYVDEEAVSESMSDCRKEVMNAWTTVFKEDVFAVEAMQEGRQSPGFQGGVFSPVMDGPSHSFHKWVAKCYEDALT